MWRSLSARADDMRWTNECFLPYIRLVGLRRWKLYLPCTETQSSISVGIRDNQIFAVLRVLCDTVRTFLLAEWPNEMAIGWAK